MKKNISYLLISCLILLNTSCWIPEGEEPQYESYDYDPVTLSRDAFENSTKLIDNQPIKKSGKIYIKDDFLIINEPNKGFHIYDNTDPENPKKLKFLQVLGSTDLSIKGNNIYANNAIDLIAISIDDEFNTINITKRIRNIFPELQSPDGFYNNETNITVDWKLKTN